MTDFSKAAMIAFPDIVGDTGDSQRYRRMGYDLGAADALEVALAIYGGGSKLDVEALPKGWAGPVREIFKSKGIAMTDPILDKNGKPIVVPVETLYAAKKWAYERMRKDRNFWRVMALVFTIATIPDIIMWVLRLTGVIG